MGFFAGMALAYEKSDRQYIAYIDEAGDPGLTRVSPIDKDGSSEWFALGAVVVRASREMEVIQWVKEIRKAIRARQGPALHFRTLTPERKAAVCKRVACLPLRCFVFLSNKKNMRQYRNARAEAARPSTQEFFYNFCNRVLLERVSEFVEAQAMTDFGCPAHMELVFSKRGGLRYSQMFEYLDLLQNQARSGTTFLAERVIRWSVFHPRLMKAVPADRSAGTQMADVVASSFFQATNTAGQGSWDPQFAEMLHLRMWAPEHGPIANNGVTLWPAPHKANLNERQKRIFRFYGYQL